MGLRMTKALRQLQLHLLVEDVIDKNWEQQLREMERELSPPILAESIDVARWGYSEELGRDDARANPVASDFYHDLALRSKDAARISPKAVHNDRS